MLDTTKADYKRLAKHFYTTRLTGTPTAKKVADALKHCAHEYRPDYWRRLRRALVFVVGEQGFHKAADKIAATQNPLTSDSARRSEVKTKQKRQRSVSKEDEQQLLDYCFEHGERTVYAALTLVSYLGCRPVELKQLVFLDDCQVMIPSAKKREGNDRGLDRIIRIETQRLFESLKDSHDLFLTAPYKDPTRYVQRRLDTLTKRLWPSRKVRPSLYSWRHQLGSDLKASGKSAAEIAAVMGHRSVLSVNVYGNRRSARNARSYLSPTREIVKRVERLNRHREQRRYSKGFTLSSITNAIQRRFSPNRLSKPR